MSKNINIPVASDLVVLGNPQLKALAQNNDSIPSHIEELNSRIDELENAIGQDNSGPIGRAFAIRAETISADAADDNDINTGYLAMEEKLI
jgi:hypothetical protein